MPIGHESQNQGRGIAMLIFGNCLLSLVLLGLQKLFGSAFERLTVLIFLNAFIGIFGVVLDSKAMFQVFKRNAVAILIWVVAACAAYTAFLIYPTQLPLGLFTVASASAPPLAAIIFSRTGNVNDRSLGIMTLFPLVLLAILALMEGHFASGANVLILFIFVVACHTAAQYGLRSTAHELRPTTVTAVNSLLASILLFSIISARSSSAFHLSQRSILCALAFAPMIVLVQFFHLTGLRKTSLSVGALGMNTAIPIAVVLEQIYAVRFHVLSLVVAILYVLAVIMRRSSAIRPEAPLSFK